MTQPRYIIQVIPGKYFCDYYRSGRDAIVTEDVTFATTFANSEAHTIRNHLAGLGYKRAVVVPAIEEEHEQHTA